MNKKFLTPLLIFSMLFGFVSDFASAGMTSTNYQIESDVLGSFGNQGSSTNYTEGDTGGEMGTGNSSSANNSLNAGFWQPSSGTPTPPTPPSSSGSAIFSVNIINDYQASLSGTAPYPGTVNIVMTGTNNAGETSTTNLGPVTVGSDGTWNLTTDPLNAGHYSFSVSVDTPSDGTINATASGSNAIDIVLAALDDFSVKVLKNGNIKISGNGFPNGKVKIKIKKNNGDVVLEETESTDAQGDFTHTTDSFPSGDYTVSVAIEDASGQVGSYKSSKDITIAEDDISATFDINIINDYQASLSGTAPYPGTVNIVMTGTNNAGETSTTNLGPVTVGSDGTWNLTTDPLNAGHYSFSVSVDTPSDGTINATASGSNAIDIGLVEVQDFSVIVLDNGFVQVSGKGFPDGTVNIEIRDGDGALMANGTEVVDASGNFTFVTTEGLPSGQYAVSVVAADMSGQVGSTHSKKNIIISSGASQDSKKSKNGNDNGSSAPASSLLNVNFGQGNPFGSFLNATEGVLASALSAMAGFIDKHPALATGIAALTGIITAFMPFILSSVSVDSMLQSFYDFLDQIWRTFLGFFGWRKKRRDWGVVYDGGTGKPISMAVVSLHDAEKGNVIETRMTDKYGSYYFFVLPGKYEVKVKKDGYIVSSSLDAASLKVFYKDMYISGTIEVTNEGVIRKDIPLIPDASARKSIWKVASFGLFKMLTRVLFFGGFFASIYLAFHQVSLENTLLAFFYTLMFLMHNVFLGEPKYGMAKDNFGKALPFVWIKVINKETGNREARVITDEKGRYFLILNEGRYLVEASSVDSKLNFSKAINFTRRKALSMDVMLYP